MLAHDRVSVDVLLGDPHPLYARLPDEPPVDYLEQWGACAAIQAARVEARIASSESLRRHPNYVVDTSRREKYVTDLVKGHSRMTIRWKARAAIDGRVRPGRAAPSGFSS